MKSCFILKRDHLQNVRSYFNGFRIHHEDFVLFERMQGRSLAEFESKMVRIFDAIDDKKNLINAEYIRKNDMGFNITIHSTEEYLTNTFNMFDGQNQMLFRSKDPEDIFRFTSVHMRSREDRARSLAEIVEIMQKSPRAYDPVKTKSVTDIDIGRCSSLISPDYRKISRTHLERARQLVGNDLIYKPISGIDCANIHFRYSGHYDTDFANAFLHAEIDPDEMKLVMERYVWHHVGDMDEELMGTFQLVHKRFHNDFVFSHIGGVSKWKKQHGFNHY